MQSDKGRIADKKAAFGIQAIIMQFIIISYNVNIVKRIYGLFLKFSLMSVAAVGVAFPLGRVHVLAALAAAGVVYLALAVLLHAFTGEELRAFTRRKKHDHRHRIGV